MWLSHVSLTLGGRQGDRFPTTQLGTVISYTGVGCCYTTQQRGLQVSLNLNTVKMGSGILDSQKDHLSRSTQISWSQKYLLYWTEELGRNCLRGNKVTVFLNWNYLILFLLWVIFQTGNKTIFKWWLKSTVWTFEFGVTICRYFSFSHFFFNLPDFVLIRSFLFCQREKHTK